MKNLIKLLGINIVAVIIGLMLLGCASTLDIRSDPFQTREDSSSSFIVNMGTGARVEFNNRKGDSLKVNGVTITTNGFSLPVTDGLYEFKFRIKLWGRGIFGFGRNFLGKADIAYNFKPVKYHRK